MTEKKKVTLSTAWRDAKELIWVHRYRLALGLFLMLVNRLVGLVLPASSKYLIDEVIIKQRGELLAYSRNGSRSRHVNSGCHLVHDFSGAWRRRATGHHRNAQECSGTHRPPAGSIF